MKILHMYPLSGPQSGKDWRAQGDRNERKKKNLFLEIEMKAEKKRLAYSYMLQPGKTYVTRKQSFRKDHVLVNVVYMKYL